MRKKFVRWLLVVGVLAVLIGVPAAPGVLAGDCGGGGGTCAT